MNYFETLKTRDQLQKVERNGYTFYRDRNPFSNRRYDMGGGGTSPEQVSKLMPEQMQLLRDIIGQINPGESLTPYQGQRVADPSQLQTTGFDLAGGLSPGIQGSQELYGQALSGYDPTQAQEMLGLGTEGLQDIMKPWDSTGATEAWQANMNPAMSLWKDTMVPFLEERGVNRTGTGMAGGTGRDIAKSGQQFASEMGGRLANDLYTGEQAHLGRQQYGVNQAMNMALAPGNVVSQAGGIAGQGTDQLAQMLNFGSGQRDINQQNLTSDQNVWSEGQPYNNQWLQQYLATALGTSAFDTVMPAQQPSLLSELAPYAMAGATAYASDVRVKENIKPIDEALKKVAKLTGFSYNYIFNEPENRNGGVMAQTLEEVMPEAVSEIKGVKFVRYDAVVGLLINAVNELQEIVRSN